MCTTGSCAECQQALFELPLTVIKGDAVDRTLLFVGPAGRALDLTGETFSAWANIPDGMGGFTKLPMGDGGLTAPVSTPAGSTVAHQLQVGLTAAQTDTLVAGSYSWALRWDSQNRTVGGGDFTILEHVTSGACVNAASQTAVIQVSETVTVVATANVGPTVPGGGDADTVDGKHADDFVQINLSGGATIAGLEVVERADDLVVVDFRNTAAPVDLGWIRMLLSNTNGNWAMSRLTDAGVSTPLLVHSPTAGFSVLAPATVLAPTAVNQPVRTTTTPDANTGWPGWAPWTSGRFKVLSWTNGVQDATNQWGTLNPAVATPVGTGYIYLERRGDRVRLVAPNAFANRLNIAAVSGANLFTTNTLPPTGFGFSVPFSTVPWSIPGYPSAVPGLSQGSSMTVYASVSLALYQAVAEWTTFDVPPTAYPTYMQRLTAPGT